jgi:D-alanyl-D-alanine carboxypeptidase
METVPLVPASNVKLLTTAAAIENWSDSLVKSIEKRLARSRRKEHRFLLDTAMLDTLGIEFPEAPRGARYLVWTSRVSDNRLADWLMTELCRSESLLPDEFAHRYLEQRGIPVPGLNITDGSGRSPLNRMAVVTITTLLCHMYCSEHRDLFLSSLPGPGSVGSLRRRGLGLGHRVRAKTGFIKASFALSGYLSAQTDTFAFSFMVNNCTSGRSAYRLFTRLLLCLYHGSCSQ